MRILEAVLRCSERRNDVAKGDSLSVGADAGKGTIQPCHWQTGGNKETGTNDARHLYAVGLARGRGRSLAAARALWLQGRT